MKRSAFILRAGIIILAVILFVFWDCQSKTEEKQPENGTIEANTENGVTDLFDLDTKEKLKENDSVSAHDQSGNSESKDSEIIGAEVGVVESEPSAFVALDSGSEESVVPHDNEKEHIPSYPPVSAPTPKPAQVKKTRHNKTDATTGPAQQLQETDDPLAFSSQNESNQGDWDTNE